MQMQLHADRQGKNSKPAAQHCLCPKTLGSHIYNGFITRLFANVMLTDLFTDCRLHVKSVAALGAITARADCTLGFPVVPEV